MSTIEYYQRSLNELRERAVEFARANPALAPHLSGPSPDPDVERLLEGVAFLNGQIHQRLDDDFPAFAQGLMNLIFPHYLRPIPSATIMQFKPKAILKNTLAVPAGTYIDSKDVEGVHCRFRTCYDLDVHPLVLNRVRQDDRGGGRRAIHLELELKGLKPDKWDNDTLRFFVGGDYAGASDLYRLLLHRLESVEIAGSGQSEMVVLAPQAVSACGFSHAEALLPYPRNAFPAFRMVQEYFVMMEKFLFLEVSGLSRWRSNRTAQFEIRFVLQPMEGSPPRITPERFTLHATPAVNLFEQDAEPITLDQRRSDLTLRAARGRAETHVVHSVASVTGHSRGVAKKREYRPLGLFEPGGDSGEPVYELSIREGDEGTEPVLSLSRAPQADGAAQQETLTVKLLCTNGKLPGSLRPGDIARPTSNTSELVEFANVSPPTAHQPAPAGRDTLWRLMSHLSLNYLTLADAANLKALLGLYLFPGGGDKRTETANRRRIDSIGEVQAQPADRLVGGVLMRGHEIKVAAGRDHFASAGDFYLFGAVLEHLFSSMAALNSFTAFTLRDSVGGEEYAWPAKLGSRPLI